MKDNSCTTKRPYHKMADLIVRDFKRIPKPGYPNSSKEDVWDAYLNFFLCAYHLKDYIQYDESLGISKSEINSFIDKSKDMKLLQSIVTGFKHLNADADHIMYDIRGLEWDDGSPKSSPEIDYEERNFILTEDEKYILCEDGKKVRFESDIEKMHPRDLAIKVLASWNKFFKEKGLDNGFVF